LFSYSASGITLDRDIQTFSESGRLLIKGFNPKNPHVGDAIIATFSWLGSTNIIDSVVDVVTTNPYTRVGNTYTLVQYVTAGGLSMATYVATNAQNFPDTSTDPNKILAIGAYLRDSVADGGVRLTSWLGVDDVFSQALGSGTGAPRSASGSGTTPTVASAGPISFNPGALVYAVSAEKPPVGVDRDPAYTTVSGAASDGVIKDDAVYSVGASGGTANPQWTWYFDQQPGGGMWLATSLTLNAAATSGNQPPVAAFSSSCSALTCNFTSTSSDPDGSIASYSWTFGDGGTSTAQNPSHTYAAGGTYTVTLRVTDNQGAQSTTTSKTVTVTAPNQAPVVNAGPDDQATTGLLYSFTWSFTDANHNGPWSYTINWGDGSTSSGTVSSEGSFSAGHTYIIILPRSFTITVTVRDAAGASTSDTKVVSVLLL
jgi:PKD repeat protein